MNKPFSFRYPSSFGVSQNGIGRLVHRDPGGVDRDFGALRGFVGIVDAGECFDEAGAGLGV